MLVVGLTGGIASGKSTASYLISSHPANIPIIDLDVLAREVVEPGQPALAISSLDVRSYRHQL